MLPRARFLRVLVGAAMLLSLFFGASWAWRQPWAPAAGQRPSDQHWPILGAAEPQPPVSILLLGVDERPYDPGRSDTMMVLRIQPDGPVHLLAIPRDTLVDIEGYGEGKANSAYTYGGAELAKKVVSNLLGVPIPYYVKVNLAGFRHMVDLIGGVPVDIDRAMHYSDPDDGLYINLKPGHQVLDGAKAEQFVRYRHDEIGDDVGRIGRQQEFLQAAAIQALSPVNLPRLPLLLQSASSYTATDLPLTEALPLARTLYSAQRDKTIHQEMLPGQGDYVDGVSFFLTDREALRELLSTWSETSAPTSASPPGDSASAPTHP